MGYGVRPRVWGDHACFNRPEMKVERVSYDVMTPSAARGILEAIHWKPAIRWGSPSHGAWIETGDAGRRAGLHESMPARPSSPG